MNRQILISTFLLIACVASIQGFEITVYLGTVDSNVKTLWTSNVRKTVREMVTEFCDSRDIYCDPNIARVFSDPGPRKFIKMYQRDESLSANGIKNGQSLKIDLWPA